MADIMITAHDRMSDTLKKITESNKYFSTSLADTQKKLDMLNKNKVTLKIWAIYRKKTENKLSGKGLAGFLNRRQKTKAYFC